MGWNPKGKKGFTLIELMLVIAIIGILAGIAIQHLSRTHSKADLAGVMDQLRDVQSIAIVQYSENYIVPTIEQINSGYARNGHTPIIDRFAIIPVNQGTGGGNFSVADPNATGGQPENFVICSKVPLKEAAYVYSLDDRKIHVAPAGSDPIGSGLCLGSASGSSGASSGGSGTPTTPTSPTAATEPPATGSGSSAESGAASGGGDSGTPTGSPSTPTGSDSSSSGSAGGSDTQTGTTDQQAEEQTTRGSCDLDAACPSEGDWRNRGAYQSCLEHAIKACYDDGLISKPQRQALHQAVGGCSHRQ